ncbi:MAG: DUF4271 domain-containing protein [Bacteroidaceae bacterium]|nr:DUF4271 domain-containing protein [Bacteroidaceae bacterium]
MEGIVSTLRAYHVSNDNIIIVGLLLVFFLFTFVICRCREILLYKIRTYFSSRQIYATDEISTNNREQVDILLLILIGLFSLSLTLYINSQDLVTVNEHGNYSTLFLVMLTLTLTVGAQICIYMFVNWIFFPAEVNKHWISSYIYLLAAASVIILPLAIIQTFSTFDCSPNISLCLIIILILQKIILFCKLYANFKPKRYGQILFFLYFCSVEIMPTLITLHVLRQMEVIS